MNKELTRQVSEVEDIELDLRRLQNNQTDAVQQLQNTLEKLQAEYVQLSVPLLLLTNFFSPDPNTQKNSRLNSAPNWSGKYVSRSSW